jgi:hypothetical protein
MCKIYQLTIRLATYLLSSLILLLGGLASDAKVLNGSVRAQDMLQKNGMNRNDISHGTDPFGGGGQINPLDQTIDAAPCSFGVPTIAPAPPPRQLHLNAQADDPQNADLGAGSAVPDTNPGVGQAENAYPNQLALAAPPPDPDQSQEMLLAWDRWHKNLASAIYQRYTSTNALFSNGPPLMVTVAYCVNRNGQITNTRFTQKSANPLFNIACMGIVSSLNGNLNVLTFPAGSRRMAVDKAAEFEVNTGNEGFKHTIHDNERIQQPR